MDILLDKYCSTEYDKVYIFYGKKNYKDQGPNMQFTQLSIKHKKSFDCMFIDNTLKVCLDTTYFAETEKLLLKVRQIKVKVS